MLHNHFHSTYHNPLTKADPRTVIYQKLVSKTATHLKSEKKHDPINLLSLYRRRKSVEICVRRPETAQLGNITLQDYRISRDYSCLPRERFDRGRERGGSGKRWRWRIKAEERNEIESYTLRGNPGIGTRGAINPRGLVGVRSQSIGKAIERGPPAARSPRQGSGSSFAIFISFSFPFLFFRVNLSVLV